jgi:hypothetical protein
MMEIPKLVIGERKINTGTRGEVTNAVANPSPSFPVQLPVPLHTYVTWWKVIDVAVVESGKLRS